MSKTFKDALADISKNVIGTGFFEKIRITAEKQGTMIEALEKDKQVILKGQTKEPIADISGVFGLGNLSLLSSITSDGEYSHKDSVIELVTEQRDGVDTPSELHYTNKSQSFIKYRFLSSSLSPDQPKYVEPKWDVKIAPTKKDITQFNWAAASLGNYEQYFYPKTVDGNLLFFIGEENGATQRGGVVFATNVTGEFDTATHKWPISVMSAILKLTDNATSEMCFSTKGAIQIRLDTGVSIFKYIFPAKIK
jgi:hypothetical protein